MLKQILCLLSKFNVFTDKLYTKEVKEDAKELPSPDTLQGYVIVKVRAYMSQYHSYAVIQNTRYKANPHEQM